MIHAANPKKPECYVLLLTWLFLSAGVMDRHKYINREEYTFIENVEYTFIDYYYI